MWSKCVLTYDSIKITTKFLPLSSKHTWVVLVKTKDGNKMATAIAKII